VTWWRDSSERGSREYQPRHKCCRSTRQHSHQNMSFLSTFRASAHANLVFRQPLRWTHRTHSSPLNVQHFTCRNLSGRARPPPRSSNFSGSQQGPNRSFLAWLDTIPTGTVFWSIVGINAGVFGVWKLSIARAVSSMALCNESILTGWRKVSRERPVSCGLDVQEFHIRVVQSYKSSVC
jgi:hypothetical protein